MALKGKWKDKVNGVDINSADDINQVAHAVIELEERETGEITQESDPTVPSWAKQPNKPTYTASEVGALPDSTKIPTKTSDLTNNSGFITKAVSDLTNYYTKSQTYTRDEVNALISAIPKFSISVVSSLPTSGISETTIYLVGGGSGSDLYTEYIYTGGKWEILGSQKVDLTGYATESWVNTRLADYLKETELDGAINTALEEAKASGMFDGKDGSNGTNGKDGTSVTVKSVSESTTDGGSNVVTFSDNKTITIKNGSKGSKGDKGDKGDTGATGATGAKGKDGADGYTPVKGVDYFDGTNGKDGEDYVLTENDKSEIADEVTKRVPLVKSAEMPLFVNSIEECTDTTKMYVLPDGFIYAYLYSEATAPSYTNLSETVHENYRMGSGGTLSALTGAVTTDFIPVRKGQTVRFKGFNPLVMPSSKYPYICFYTGASESNAVSEGVWDRLDFIESYHSLPQDDNGVWSYTAFISTQAGVSGANSQHKLADSITHIRMCGTMLEGETVIVTVDEEITEGGSTGGYEWVNTGHAFVPADYEDRIVDLENNKANKNEIPTKLPTPNKLTIDGVEYDGSKEVNIETQSGGNILYGKKWVACGDSFTAGGYNASDGFDESEYIYQDGRFAGRYKVYPNIIGLRNNMNIVNLATGGQTMATTSANNSFMTRYANIDADADYITIMLGINDKLQGVSIGAIDSTDTSTFCGAFNIAMEHILENHPFAHIGIMVSHGTNAEIMEATRDIAERWGVPYLDYGSPQVPLMNRYTGRNVCAKAQEIREKNFCVISDGITPTNAHPNTAAHEYESTFIEAWLRTL
jgi:lysophospholipase L1-like esterase